MYTPKFSILICNYNYGKYIAEAIESCLKQDYPQELIEIIVVDDGSTDNSQEILSSFQAISNIKVIKQINSGQASAFYTASIHATGDYICLLDSDDKFRPSKLTKIAEKISSLIDIPKDFFLCHDSEIYNEKEKTLSGIKWFDIIKWPIEHLDCLDIDQVSHPFPFAIPCGQIFSTTLFKKIIAGIPLADWRISADEPIAQAAFLTCGKIHYSAEVLSEYRIHDNNFLLSIDNNCHVFQKADWTKHRPKLLYFLEKFLDTLHIDAKERAERINYLYTQEKLVRNFSARKKYTEPKVSFIVTNYNYSLFIADCINSLINQTHNNYEIIVVDDQSTDSSIEVIQKFKNVKLIQNTNNIGQLGSMREGYKEADGHYIVFVDADDLVDPYFAERHLYTHRFLTLCMVTSCDLNFINESNELIHANFYYSSGYWKQQLEYFSSFGMQFGEWIFTSCSGNMFRKTHMLDLFFDNLDEETIKAYRITGDWLPLHFAHAIGGSARFNESLVNFRIHDKNNCTQIPYPTRLVRDLKTGEFDSGAGIIYMLKLLCNNYSKFDRHYLNTGIQKYLEWISMGDKLAKSLYERAQILEANQNILEMLNILKESQPSILPKTNPLFINSSLN